MDGEPKKPDGDDIQDERRIAAGIFNINSKDLMLFHLWEKPSFSNWAGWTVFLPDFYSRNLPMEKITPWIREVMWDRYAKPEPMLVTQVAPLIDEEFKIRMKEVEEIRIPIVGVHELGSYRDGTDHGIQMDSSNNGYSLYWHSSGPKEWQPFTDWAYRMGSYLSNAIYIYNHKQKGTHVP